MATQALITPFADVDAALATINAANGTVVAALNHPYSTDEFGRPCLLLIWTAP